MKNEDAKKLVALVHAKAEIRVDGPMKEVVKKILERIPPEDLIEAAANNLANANHVEAAWAFRGILDAASNTPPQDVPDYQRPYLKGYRFGKEE